jgi:hypothetical protein
MNFIKKTAISSLILASTLLSNPGTKISTFGNIGAKIDRSTTNLEEIISFNSNSFAGVLVDCDEVPFFNIKGYYTTDNGFKPELKYNLYDELTDSLTIQGIELNSNVNNNIFESQGYGLESKYFDFFYENKNDYQRNKTNFVNISWIKEEQENNEELQDIIGSIYDSDWDTALMEFISASITNSLEASLGDFEKITEQKKIQTWTDKNSYTFSIKIPNYNLENGIKKTYIEKEIYVDDFFFDKINYEENNFFTNYVYQNNFKNTNISLFLNQDIKTNSFDDKEYDINGDLKIITLPKQRHILSMNLFYNNSRNEKYDEATGMRFEIKNTNSQEEFCKNEINKFKELNQIKNSPMENSKLKYSLIDEIENTFASEGSSFGTEIIHSDFWRVILDMAYFGKENGMKVKYDVSKQGGKITYVFGNKGYLGISIYRDIKLSAGLHLEF